MKTDSLFYRLLQAEPTLAFELAGVDVPQHEGYNLISQEIKQTAFRLDGIAEPPSDRPGAPRGYVEVQFQPADGIDWLELLETLLVWGERVLDAKSLDEVWGH